VPEVAADFPFVPCAWWRGRCVGHEAPVRRGGQMTARWRSAVGRAGPGGGSGAACRDLPPMPTLNQEIAQALGWDLDRLKAALIDADRRLRDAGCLDPARSAKIDVTAVSTPPTSPADSTQQGDRLPSPATRRSARATSAGQRIQYRPPAAPRKWSRVRAQASRTTRPPLEPLHPPRLQSRVHRWCRQAPSEPGRRGHPPARDRPP
jgi:hypothetical protein